jgi:hypothetical protein
MVNFSGSPSYLGKVLLYRKIEQKYPAERLVYHFPPDLSYVIGMHKMTRSPVFLMALTLFIDFAGFGIILPLLLFWAERLRAGPVGVGLVLTIYALAQFLFTPLRGTLSWQAAHSSSWLP